MIRWHVQHLHPTVLLWIPFQFVIVPRLRTEDRHRCGRVIFYFIIYIDHGLVLAPRPLSPTRKPTLNPYLRIAQRKDFYYTYVVLRNMISSPIFVVITTLFQLIKYNSVSLVSFLRYAGSIVAGKISDPY